MTVNPAKGLLKRKLPIKYKVELRSNSVDAAKDEEFIMLLKESGMHRVFVGIESGSDDMLNYLEKGTTMTQNRQFVELMRSCGIDVNIGRIVFGPYTDWQVCMPTTSARR